MKTYLQKEVIKEFLDALEKKIGKKLLFLDMDGVICNFDKEAERRSSLMGISAQEFKDKKYYRQPTFYESLEPTEGALEAIEKLKKKYEIRILSAPSWGNPSSFTEKRIWIEKYLGEWGEKRMDLTFRKDLSIGHFLVDDRTKYGASDFIGEHLMFGTNPFNTFKDIENYLL